MKKGTNPKNPKKPRKHRENNTGSTGKYLEWLKPDNLLRVQAWTRDGLTDEQVAHNMGITSVSLYAWRRKFPELAEACRKGKEVVDIEVENSLLKRCHGFVSEETTYENGVVTKRIERQVPPDTTALIFWLKNRKPKEYRDVNRLEVSGDLNIADALKEARERAAKRNIEDGEQEDGRKDSD